MDSVTSSGRFTDEWWIGKDLEGNGARQIKFLFRDLPRGTEKNHENLSQI
jgi:hypothetical protein